MNIDDYSLDTYRLARWLCAVKEFADRPGPRLELDAIHDQFVLIDPLLEDEPAPSPEDLAQAILQFLEEPKP